MKILSVDKNSFYGRTKTVTTFETTGSKETINLMKEMLGLGISSISIKRKDDGEDRIVTTTFISGQ